MINCSHRFSTRGLNRRWGRPHTLLQKFSLAASTMARFASSFRYSYIELTHFAMDPDPAWFDWTSSRKKKGPQNVGPIVTCFTLWLWAYEAMTSPTGFPSKRERQWSHRNTSGPVGLSLEDGESGNDSTYSSPVYCLLDTYSCLLGPILVLLERRVST